ncbi:histidinol-phosphate transaminase [Thalassotalea ganghwensis]
MTVANKLARPELIDMVPYQSARRLYAGGEDFNNKVWLNANEAPGTGAYQVNGERINRYPDFQPENLINAYCRYSGVQKNQLLATRGADEGIELVIRTFCQSYQDSILICPPTYGMYAISAENQGASVVKVPLINQQLDLTGLEAQVGKVKVVFLCSPGNPTGNLLPKEQIEAALNLFANSAIVVVDEAYIEFAPENSAVSWLSRYPNLVVLRTLSKAFALAGLRCGFTIANEDIIEMISKVIAPYPISAPVADIASDALSIAEIEQMRARVRETSRLRTCLSNWLAEQSWCQKVYPSDANFILFACSDKDRIFNLLKDQGILIRDQSKQLQLDNCLRVSIGSESELELFKQTIAKDCGSQSELSIKEN